MTDASDTRMGTVLSADGAWTLRYERHLARPPEKVWRALTESEHLEHWLRCDIVGDRREGAALVLPFWPATVTRYGIEQPVLHGRITVWQPPAVFEWMWDTDRLRFELTPADGGTDLGFTTWIADGDVGPDAAAGYHVCLDLLEALLDTGAVPPVDDAQVEVLEARYEAARAASGEPA